MSDFIDYLDYFTSKQETYLIVFRIYEKNIPFAIDIFTDKLNKDIQKIYDLLDSEVYLFVTWRIIEASNIMKNILKTYVPNYKKDITKETENCFIIEQYFKRRELLKDKLNPKIIYSKIQEYSNNDSYRRFFDDYYIFTSKYR